MVIDVTIKASLVSRGKRQHPTLTGPDVGLTSPSCFRRIGALPMPEKLPFFLKEKGRLNLLSMGPITPADTGARKFSIISITATQIVPFEQQVLGGFRHKWAIPALDGFGILP
jgi:hypothetical protein